MADKKGVAAAIVSAMPKPQSEEQDEYSAKDAAAEDILRALEEKDPGSLKEALAAFVESCQH